jgi:putative membrane protein
VITPKHWSLQKEAKDAKDVKFREVALQGKPMVAEHKTLAYDLKKKL